MEPPTKPKDELLGIRIPAELKRVLKNAAVANGLTLSGLVQKILVEWARRQKLLK